MMTLSYDVPGPSPAASSTTVDDRSTAFQPVEGGTEHRSGEALLVGAYGGLWLILMGWLLVQWKKQGALGRRVVELEALVQAASRAPTRPAAAARPEQTP
jgi:hypothetical protein